MTEPSDMDLLDSFSSIIETFIPGLSQLIRLASLVVGIDLISYFFYISFLLAIPVVLNLILLWAVACLKPIFARAADPSLARLRRPSYFECFNGQLCIRVGEGDAATFLVVFDESERSFSLSATVRIWDYDGNMVSRVVESRLKVGSLQAIILHDCLFPTES
ncbi:hypothetical protein N7540_011201 [Penicillium herquei]|nr:hypothetical protein N7540_013234 [Penicillium herquei]KAJ6004719.1 hypothetical protein N7540_013088 [Penicillium herquei]KAJ6016610.1 hypothetical protein N7540_011201 [Penicillium herquei]